MPAKPPRPGRPPKPPANPGALEAADAPAAPAAPAAAARAASAFIWMKGRKASGFIRGPSELLTMLFVSPMASHSGITPYEETRLDAMFPSENPDVDKIPPGPKVVDDPVDAEDKGDARVWSAPVIAEVSCDSTDCTPVPIDEPAD